MKDLLNLDIKHPTGFVYHRHTFSPAAERLLPLLIFNAQKTTADNDGFFTLPFRVAKVFCGWEHAKDDKRFIERCRELKKAEIEWNFLGFDRSLEEQIVCSFLITMRIKWKEKLIQYEIHPRLLPAVMSPNLYAQIKLIMLVVLQESSYDYPLYCIGADIASRSIEGLVFSRDELFAYLDIPEGQYSDTKTFNRNVLNRSLQRIAKKSNILLEWKPERQAGSKRITGYRFRAQFQPWQPPLMPLLETEIARIFHDVMPIQPRIETLSDREQAFIDQAENAGVNRNQALKAMRQHGVEQMEESLAYGLDQLKRAVEGQGVANPGGFLRSFLVNAQDGRTAEEKRQGEPTPRQRERGRQEERERQRQKEKRIRDVEEQVSAVKKRYYDELISCARTIERQLKKDDRITAEEEYKSTLNGFVRSKFDGLNHNLTRLGYAEFLIERFHKVSIPSVEEYMAQQGIDLLALERELRELQGRAASAA